MKHFKQFFKLLTLFAIGGCTYMGIEIAYRGFTHWTMGVLGGLCFLIIGALNEFYTWDMNFWKQCGIGSIVVTTLEFIFGMILNVWLGLGIWDYSNLPLNICGQVCLWFTFAWFGLSAIAIVLDDWLRYWLFGEEKPYYKFK